MRIEFDEKKLLDWLEKLSPPKDNQKAGDIMKRVSMAAALPALTEIEHENEYRLCQTLATHLVGKIHEPEAGDL